MKQFARRPLIDFVLADQNILRLLGDVGQIEVNPAVALRQYVAGQVFKRGAVA
jgi:hypothetical protein